MRDILKNFFSLRGTISYLVGPSITIGRYNFAQQSPFDVMAARRESGLLNHV